METLDFNKLAIEFQITKVKPQDAMYSVKGLDLVDPDHMQEFLAHVTPFVKALDLAAAGAYFARWIGDIALAQQYIISVYNSSLDMSLINLTIHFIPTTQARVPVSFQIHDCTEQKAPTNEKNRQLWLQQRLVNLYSESMRPLFATLSNITNWNVGQVWGQLPTKFEKYIESYIIEATQTKVKERLKQDYIFLKEEIDSHVFGRIKNPFNVKFRMVEHMEDPEKQLRMKHACCLYHKIENGYYCYTCPQVRDEERAARREIHRNA
ncbi:ferric iron reductase protein FhuF [Paenibacillus sp. DS2015]|uniref:(2Fe-2S)-binding protein n=1 Tax=Paenibacillus sp. DS2015 TaxID=3373917 RepID=UPI003D1E45D9